MLCRAILSVWAKPNVDGMLGIVRLALACGLYNRHIEMRVKLEIEIHSDSVKHSPLSLLNSMDVMKPEHVPSAPRLRTTPSTYHILYKQKPDVHLGPSTIPSPELAKTAYV